MFFKLLKFDLIHVCQKNGFLIVPHCFSLFCSCCCWKGNFIFRIIAQALLCDESYVMFASFAVVFKLLFLWFFKPLCKLGHVITCKNILHDSYKNVQKLHVLGLVCNRLIMNTK